MSQAGKWRSHFYSLTVAPPQLASTRTHALAGSGHQAGVLLAILPNKESTRGIHAIYPTAEGLSAVTFWKVPVKDRLHTV